MPWHIETDNPDCSGYAVVKDADGEVEGCHRTREQAERQLAVLNIAEDEDENDEGIDDDETRAGQGPLAIITDIDGTLRLEGRNNEALIDYLNSSEADIIVLTGRNESDRDSTEDYLDSIGLDYETLEMSTGGNPAAYKKRVASRLLQRYTIEEAYENDEAARNAYESLGINAKAPTPNSDRAREILAQHLQR